MRRNGTLFSLYTIAHELGMDIDEVKQWTPSKVREWMTYFAVKSDLESEAYQRAQRRASGGNVIIK